ncbi:MAG: serine/threonine-protein kinase [Elusimicrobiota bacterium]
MELRRGLLMVFLSSSSALAADADISPWKRLDEIANVEAQTLCQEAEPNIRDLKGLAPSYMVPSQFESVSVKRQTLRIDLQRRLDDLETLRNEYRSTQKALQTELAIKTLKPRKRKTGELIDEESKQSLVQYYVYDQAFNKLQDCLVMLTGVISKDEAAFVIAQDAMAKRRFRTQVIGGVSAAAVLVLGLSLFIAKRMAASTAAEVLVTQPMRTTQPMRVTGPTGRPALPLDRAAPADAIGTVLGENFRLDKVIGKGGMGVVYLAQDLTLDRKVAIKRMREEVSDNERELANFVSEARLVASLKHPGIVEIYSIIKEQGRLYLVFEFVEGNTLDSALHVCKRLTLAQARSVLRQIASALDYAHSRKIIHRDLKPSNIMLTPAGTARVMDFGVAYQAKKAVAALTRAEVWGTPPYMAPEQELGSVTNEADLFSLAACFYEMLTGKVPFPGPNYLAQKREMRFIDPSKLIPALPVGLDTIMRRALAPDPRQRFHSGAELATAVERV